MASRQRPSKPSTVKLDTTRDTYVLFLDMLEVSDTDNVEQVVGRS